MNHQLVEVKFGKFSEKTFEHQEVGIKGVGKNHLPIIGMDKYIDTSMNQEIHQEICIGLAMAKNYTFGRVVGTLPPKEAQKTGTDFYSEQIRNIENFDPDGIHRQNIEYIFNNSPDPISARENTWKYCYFAMGSTIPWYFTFYLRRQSFIEKTRFTKLKPDGSTRLEWEPGTEMFAKTKKFIESLPFESIGRVLFFTTYPNVSVPTHRDYIVAPHKDHNINFFFTGGWRPSFVYDEVKEEKIYLERGSTCYFFNNRDYHGVDPEPRFRYTLRVDGTFNQEMQAQLGLEDGYVYHESYEQ